MGSKGKKEHKITEADISVVCGLRLEGLSLPDIVLKTNISISTVRWILTKNNIRLSALQRSKNRIPSRLAQSLASFVKYGVKSGNELMEKWAVSKNGHHIGNYVNSNTLTDFICFSGHKFKASPNNIKNGCWCKKCVDASLRLLLDEVKGRALIKNFEFLSKEYTGIDDRHLYKCSLGHEFSSTPTSIDGGHGCSVCSGNQHSTLKSLSSLASLKDLVLIVHSENVMSKAVWRCSMGHEFKMRPNNVQQGQGCPICCAGNHSSKGQIEIFEYIKSILKEEVVLSDRVVINPLELDIYVPSRNVGIEYNGLIWHSSYIENLGNKYNPRKHFRKALACRGKGINLLAIFEDEWKNKQELVKSMIRWRLGVFSGIKLNARSLELKRLDKNIYKDFFERNHLDGHVQSSFGYGLFKDDKLVMCVSVRKNFVGELEIARLATDFDYTVRGGAARLVTAIKKENKSSLISYSNNRLSHGNVYKKLGFVKKQENGPSYWYTDGKIRIWRFNCKRNNDLGIISRFPTEKLQALNGVFSEKYFSDDRSLYQIHDYGHIKWELGVI